jgi:hypothetical protein
MQLLRRKSSAAVGSKSFEFAISVTELVRDHSTAEHAHECDHLEDGRKQADNREHAQDNARRQPRAHSLTHSRHDAHGRRGCTALHGGQRMCARDSLEEDEQIPDGREVPRLNNVPADKDAAEKMRENVCVEQKNGTEEGVSSHSTDAPYDADASHAPSPLSLLSCLTVSIE